MDHCAVGIMIRKKKKLALSISYLLDPFCFRYGGGGGGEGKKEKSIWGTPIKPGSFLEGIQAFLFMSKKLQPVLAREIFYFD